MKVSNARNPFYSTSEKTGFCQVMAMSQVPRSLEDWESAIDKQVREAMERGDFDNLRGTGKPLNLARDPK